jgi:glycosyltransferase involved in cell wall biosynthesis
MKIFTASPLALTADSWERDIVVLARGFASMGHQARCVRLHSPDGSDFPGVLQIGIKEMESADWWSNQKCDIVVVNTWGNPKFSPIIRAIKTSGAKVVIRLDSNGLNSPHCGYLGYASLTFGMEREAGRGRLASAIKAAVKTVLYSIPAVYDRRMAQHLELADAVTIESEGAKQNLVKALAFCGKTNLAECIHVAPHPVVPEIEEVTVTENRRNVLMCVGRWDSYFKDARLMGRLLAETLKRFPGWKAWVFGRHPECVEREYRRQADSGSVGAVFYGPRPHSEILTAWNTAKVCLFTSRHESGPIAGEEALCLGCSLVGPPDVPSMLTLSAPPFGTLPKTRHFRDMAAAVSEEIRKWDAGERSSAQIAEAARREFSPATICARILGGVA